MFAISTRPPLAAIPILEDEPSSSSKYFFEDDKMKMKMEMDIDDDGYGAGSSGGPHRNVVRPGEIITSSREYMRGHGTYVEEEQVVSSVAGTIERVNKLISVKPLKSRYTPEVGDLVIGRIVEVGSSRWKVDANARQDAVLMLSSVNLPGGVQIVAGELTVQRRKVEQDALKMREFLAEGDLLVAEVQAFFGDGAMSLHTRSLKYGKLRNGLLQPLPPHLIRRLKSHFHHLPPPCGPTGVDVILGLNGWVWVSAASSSAGLNGEDGGKGKGQGQGQQGDGFDAEGVYSNVNDDIPPESRSAISTIASLIRLYAEHDIPLSDNLLVDGYQWVSKHSKSNEGIILSTDEGERLIADIVGVDVRVQ